MIIRFSKLLAVMLLLLVAVASSPGAAGAEAPNQAQPNTGNARRDVTYCMADGIPLKMDIFLPVASGKPAPAVLYVHGGSWIGGDKFEVGFASAELTARGYLVASINYRLAPQYKWPAQIEDAKCAVRYLRANATTLNLDPNRIAAWGSSAGGHLAALLGLTGPQAGFEGRGGYSEQSSRVQAVIDMFGPTDLAAYSPDKLAVGIAEAVFGVRPGDPLGVLVKASPVTYVTRDAPPFLILQGDKDDIVPFGQSQTLYDRLRSAGANATLVTVKNAGHGFVPVGGVPNPNIIEIRDIITNFLQQHLGNAGNDARLFPETGKTVRGAFLRYWQQRGGLRQQGLPISEETQEVSLTDGKPYTVQYFERAVFELHPENPPPHDVLLSLLGAQQYNRKYPQGAPNQIPNSAPGSVFFQPTGKRVGGRFLQYWSANGDLSQNGYPVSDEFTEVSEVDGKPYTVQYFERAVFEFHPENAPPNDVLLSLLGALRYREQR